MEKLKYYKGETSNPYEEINEKQGAWCNRYNPIASAMWFFEYHWVNGLDKYKLLPIRRQDNYFKLYKNPQKEFDSLDSALCAFVFSVNELWGGTNCKRWCNYLYENAMQERFFSPVGHVVPTKDVPAYLVYYRGEIEPPMRYKNTAKGILWNVEFGWYKFTEQISQASFEEYREAYLMRSTKYTDKQSKEYKQELANSIKIYNSYK